MNSLNNKNSVLENPYFPNIDKSENISISFRVPINLGDTVIFTVFLEQVKKVYPNIFVIVDGHRTFNQEHFELNPFAELLKNNKNIDLLILNPLDFLKLEGKPIIKYHYHMDILMIQLCFLGAWQKGAHEAELFCDIFGIDRPVKIEPKIYLNDDEIKFGKKVLDEKFRFPDKEKILIHPKAINPLKQWPKYYWEQLINNLYDKYEFIQVGCDDNWIIPNTINLVKENYSIRQVASIAFNIKYFIGVDSGIHHVCRAVNTKCIVIAPSIYPKSLWSYPEDVVLIRDNSQIKCAFCGQNRLGMAVWGIADKIPLSMDRGRYCCTNPICIKSITVDEVYKSVLTFFYD